MRLKHLYEGKRVIYFKEQKSYPATVLAINTTRDTNISIVVDAGAELWVSNDDLAPIIPTPVIKYALGEEIIKYPDTMSLQEMTDDLNVTITKGEYELLVRCYIMYKVNQRRTEREIIEKPIKNFSKWMLANITIERGECFKFMGSRIKMKYLWDTYLRNKNMSIIMGILLLLSSCADVTTTHDANSNKLPPQSIDTPTVHMIPGNVKHGIIHIK